MSQTWNCESIRLSALWDFPQQPEEALALNWESAVGTQPEQIETQPKLGASREVGQILDGFGNLERRVSPGRIDWLIGPIVPSDRVITQIPNIGGVQHAYETFRDLLFARVAQACNAPRFAIGMVAMLPAKDKDASYAELSRLLVSSKIDLSGASNFVYQINRPRQSKRSPDILINRVSVWTSAALTGVRILLPPQQAVQQAIRQIDHPMVFVTRVELDINNGNDKQELLPLDTREGLLTEFGDLAFEILARGDVR